MAPFNAAWSFQLMFVLQRIAEIIKRRNKQRLAKAAALAKKEAAGDYSHLKNKKGEFIYEGASGVKSLAHSEGKVSVAERGRA